MVKYYVAQPWYKPKDVSFLYEPLQYQMRDFDVVHWNINSSFSYARDNLVYTGLTSNTARNNAYNPAVDDYLTTQVKFTFSTPLAVWKNHDKVDLGGMLQVYSNGGKAIGYGNYFIQSIDITTNKEWWWQANYFDERGAVNRDSIYVDKFTGQAAIASEIGHSKYSTPIEGSNALATTPWDGMRFYGVTIHQHQIEQALSDMKAAGFDISLNANDHYITAYGVAPELAFADSASWIEQYTSNVFLRAE